MLHTMQRKLLLKVLAVVACLTVRSWAHEGHAASNDPPPTSFNDPKITQDESHLKDHMKDEINVNKQMTRNEMEFHYFRIHDVNNDTLLDGLEILQAMSHMMPVPELQLQDKLGKSNEQIEQLQKERQEGMMKYFEELIDQVLVNDDVNQDGYLTYSEFVKARRRDEYNSQRMHAEYMQKQQQENFQQFQQFQEMQNQPQQGQNKPSAPPPPPPVGQQQATGQQLQYQQQATGQQQQYQQQPPAQQQYQQPPAQQFQQQPPAQQQFQQKPPAQQQFQQKPPAQQQFQQPPAQQFQQPPPTQRQQQQPPVQQYQQPPTRQQPNVRVN